MDVLERTGIDDLITALRADGREVIGPVERHGAIVLDAIERADDLPVGRTDRQEPGRYRLIDRGDGARFAFACGPSSWKRWLTPPRERLWSVTEGGATGLRIEPDDPDSPPVAFLGVRPCDLAAIEVLDRVFLDGAHPDPAYAARRAAIVIVAVACAEPAGTCFCAPTGTGPSVGPGADLALSEIVDREGILVLAEAGSERGARILDRLPRRAATPADLARGAAAHDRAVRRMGRTLDVRGLPADLSRAAEHPRWEATAARCLACGNCTSVCPTCFCHTVEDVTDVGGECAERVRRSDSCFTLEFSYVHGGAVRASRGARYRHWITHKLGSWEAQFGTLGCVGCGRCITWCPVGIDLIEEVHAVRGGHEEVLS